MKRFSELFREIDSTTSTNSKVLALVKYFKSETPRNISWALSLLLEKQKKRILTSQKLREACRDFFHIDEWLFKECYAHVGDSAETISLLVQNIDIPKKERKDYPLYIWMEEKIPALAKMPLDQVGEQILDWWTRLDNHEIFILNKLMTGGFRFGVSEKLVVKALAKAFEIPESGLYHRLMGVRTFDKDTLDLLISEDGEQEISQPYPFYLAYTLDVERFKTEDLKDWVAEWKWDGIRSQFIYRKKENEAEFFIWSRGEDLITERFPEFHPELKKLDPGTVLDGEILAWKDDEVQPFNLLQTRIGRKTLSKKVLETAPVKAVIFDVIEHKGEDIRSKPLNERRKILETIFEEKKFNNFILARHVNFNTFDDLEDLRTTSREHRVEGLMLKRKSSEYGIGRKVGDWWKFKIDPYTLDAVLLYAQAGSGKRANLFTDYTFALWDKKSDDEQKLVPFAKAYSGLDNKEIDELDRWIRRNTVEKFGPVRSLKPHHIFEIAFEGVASSGRHKSGVAVRFPRILRWRKDKPIEDANTLEDAKKLIHD